MRLTLTIPAAFESSRAQLAGVLAHDRAGARSSLAERTHEQSRSRTERSPAAVTRRTDCSRPEASTETRRHRPGRHHGPGYSPLFPRGSATSTRGSATSSPGLQVPGAAVPPGLQAPGAPATVLDVMSQDIGDAWCSGTSEKLDVPGHWRRSGVQQIGEASCYGAIGTVRGCAL